MYFTLCEAQMEIVEEICGEAVGNAVRFERRLRLGREGFFCFWCVGSVGFGFFDGEIWEMGACGLPLSKSWKIVFGKIADGPALAVAHYDGHGDQVA